MGGTTENVTLVVDVPLGVVTVMVLGPNDAVAVMARVAVIEVELDTVKLLTVTSAVETFTEVVPVKLAPVMVTGTLAFCSP